MIDPGLALPTAPLENLRRRAELLRALREFFHSHGYWEVETPLLSHDCCVDEWLDPFEVPLPRGTAYLQTSPEFGMKRLLVAGADRIFQVTRSFRRDESGERHNCEFTLVEWYAVDEDHHGQMQFVEQLVRTLVKRARSEGWCQLELPDVSFPRITWQQAFVRDVGIDPLNATLEVLQAAVKRVPALSMHADVTDRSSLLNLLLAECVEPALCRGSAVFLQGYPPAQAALAKIDPGPPATAERFELYLEGRELCNGYHELTDADELLRRMLEQNIRRVAAGKQELPAESRLVAAMRSGFPNCAGVALGFDRLVMSCLGARHISDVIPFPFERA